MSETMQAYQRMRHEVSLLEATLQDEPMAVHRITLRYLLEIAAIHLPPQGMDLVAQSASSLRGEHAINLVDARLVQAAPHMLAVLRDIIASSDADCGDSLANAVNEARNIVAKATGVD